METRLPPPPKPRKTGLIIGIVAGIILILCLCVVMIAGVILFRDQIPGVSSLFATPTPEGKLHDNPTYGIHFTYPYDWVVEDDDSGIIIVATSQEAIDADVMAENHAFALFIVDPTINQYMYLEVGLNSVESMLDNLLDQELFNVGQIVELERQTNLTLGGYPAATFAYIFDGDNFRQVNYMVVILSGETPTSIFFFTSESYWTTYRPLFDSVLNSLTFDY